MVNLRVRAPAAQRVLLAAFCLYAPSAAALRPAATPRACAAAPDPLLRLRGGGEKRSVGPMLVTASAAHLGAIAAAMFVGRNDLANKLSLNINKWPNDKALAGAYLGWVAGKVCAVCEGEAAVKRFCALNTIPMVLVLYANVQLGAPLLTHCLPGFLLLAYGYVAFVERPTSSTTR